MNKKTQQFFYVTIVKFLIYGIAITGAFLYRKTSPNWPFYLLLIGILIGNFSPIEYRSNFFSTDPGIFFKKHTRRLENIIEMVITCIIIFLIMFLSTF